MTVSYIASNLHFRANLVKMDNPALLVPLVQQDHEDFLECPVSLV